VAPPRQGRSAHDLCRGKDRRGAPARDRKHPGGHRGRDGRLSGRTGIAPGSARGSGLIVREPAPSPRRQAGPIASPACTALDLPGTSAMRPCVPRVALPVLASRGAVAVDIPFTPKYVPANDLLALRFAIQAVFNGHRAEAPRVSSPQNPGGGRMENGDIHTGPDYHPVYRVPCLRGRRRRRGAAPQTPMRCSPFC